MAPSASQPPAPSATAASPSALSAALVLSEPLLQRRLDAGLAIAGGARGSLTRALPGHGTATSNSSSAAPALLQLEMTKLALILQRNERMLQKFRQEEEEEEEERAAAKTTTTGNTTTTNNETMRQRLATARAVHACCQSYEGLATAILQKHVVSESRLMADLAQVESQYEMATDKLHRTKLTAKTRAAQCHLLQRCVLDLQQSVEEEEQGEEERGSKEVGERLGETKKGGVGKKDGDGDAVMKDASAVEEDDEEGELLYGDLDSHL